jgi:hypothetical protein
MANYNVLCFSDTLVFGWDKNPRNNYSMKSECIFLHEIAQSSDARARYSWNSWLSLNGDRFAVRSLNAIGSSTEAHRFRRTGHWPSDTASIHGTALPWTQKFGSKPVSNSSYSIVWTREQDDYLNMTSILKFCDLHTLNSIPSTISWHRNEIFRFQSVSCASIGVLLWPSYEGVPSLIRTFRDARMSCGTGWRSGVTYFEMISRDRRAKHFRDRLRCSWTLSGPWELSHNQRLGEHIHWSVQWRIMWSEKWLAESAAPRPSSLLSRWDNQVYHSDLSTSSHWTCIWSWWIWHLRMRRASIREHDDRDMNEGGDDRPQHSQEIEARFRYYVHLGDLREPDRGCSNNA